MRLADVRISRRAMVTSWVLGLFILLDLALFGWLIFRSLSEREIERVLLDTREQAEGLAEKIAGRALAGDRDLYTAVASEQETLSYIDSILEQRDVVHTLEIRDRDGLLVYRSYTEVTIPSEPGGGLPAVREPEVPSQLDTRTTQAESSFTLEGSPLDIDVPIGELGYVHVGISPGRLQQKIAVLRGELIRMVGVIGAVTATLLLAAYLAVWLLYRRGQRLEEQAAEAERMAYIGTLASGLAHEIRNPLNSLRLNMQMLEEDLGSLRSGTDRKILAITRSEIARLERLATDFLTYARPRPLDLESVRAVELLEAARQVLAGDIAAHGVTLRVVDHTGGARVKVDRGQMKQLLLNLLHNAIAAASEGGGNVSMEVRRRDEAVVLEVSDDGPGIPRPEQAKIFDLFYSTRKGGTGLGLAIVRRIAQAHGADLSVVSSPGSGTTLGVSLAGEPETAKKGVAVEPAAESAVSV